MPRTAPIPRTRLSLLGALLVGFALASAPAGARDPGGRWGLGLEGGITSLSGGDRSYSNVDQHGSIRLNRELSAVWNLQLALTYGYVRPAVGTPYDGPAGFSFDSGAPLYTPLLQPMLRVQRRIPASRTLVPFVGAGAGLTSWKVVDKTGQDVGAFPGGSAAQGYDRDGNPVALKGTEFTFGLEVGLDIMLSPAWDLTVGGRLNFMPAVDKDNVGLSALWGPDHVDANKTRSEGYLAVTWWWGDGDKDNDGIVDAQDACPHEAEDRDGYRDEDGCPDPDNDGDGIADEEDGCPDQPEDMDGYRDEDGCPDPDNDGDGVVDARDACPDEAEDMDGYRDEDGCPDLDNDGDGVPDGRDRCPETPAGADVDSAGCSIVAAAAAVGTAALPVAGQRIVLEGVTFRTASARLSAESLPVIDRLAAALVANPAAVVEIRGHTDSVGEAAVNLDLSQRRAGAVRDALIQRGVAPNRVSSVGYGEDFPVADNATPEGRAANRRVELHRHE